MTPILRVLVALLALVGYVAATIGYPLPAPSTDQARTSGSPCGNRNCGCVESEQCRGSCCCSGRAAAKPPACPRCVASSHPQPVVWVSGIAARECQGQETVWTVLHGAAPPPSPLTWSFENTPAGELPLFAVIASPLTFSPPVPPPRG